MKTKLLSLLALFPLFIFSTPVAAIEACELNVLKKACLASGFKLGAWKQGIGLWAHCLNPLIKGKAQPTSAKISLPQVSSLELEACKPQPIQTVSDSFDGSVMKVKKLVTHSASSSIRYYKFIKTAVLPKGTSYLSKISGKVRLQQSGDYSLSLNSIMIAPRCPTENQVPFLYYDKTFFNYMGPVQYNLAQFILRGTSAAALDYTFPSPVPVSGCLVFIFDGGPLSGTATFTMSADLKLEFDESASAKHSRNPVLLSSGHEFFPYGENTAMAYLQPIWFKSELRSIYGNYSNLGTNHSITEFYVAKGGCGTFPKKPFANYVLKYLGSRAALLAHLPVGSTQFHRIEKTTLNGQAGLIQETISHKLEVPVDLEAGDCLISIAYAPEKAKLSGANFENQMKYFLLPR